MKCTKCNYESLNLNAKFCKKCGSKLVREKNFCSNCGNKISYKSNFCGNCGKNYFYMIFYLDRKSTRLNSSHVKRSRMQSSA